MTEPQETAMGRMTGGSVHRVSFLRWHVHLSWSDGTETVKWRPTMGFASDALIRAENGSGSQQ